MTGEGIGMHLVKTSWGLERIENSGVSGNSCRMSGKQKSIPNRELCDVVVQGPQEVSRARE